MEYKKLMSSKVMELSKDNGLIIELTEGKATNVLAIWLMYKDDNNNWAYKGTRNGATAIRIPMSSETASYLVDSIKSASVINEKVKTAETKTEGMTLEELKKRIAELEGKVAPSTSKTKKEDVKKEDTGLEIELGDVSKMTKKDMLKLIKSLVK